MGRYNTGDELLFQLIQEKFAVLGLSLQLPAAVTLYPFAPSTNCEQIHIDVIHSYDFVVLGGGTILTLDNYKCELTSANQANIPLFVAGSGWDPHRRLNNGDSFKYDNQQERSDWFARFNRTGSTGYGGVRGQWSMQSMLHFVPHTALQVIGDAGMLMPLQWQRPTFVPEHYKQWIAVGYGEVKEAVPHFYHTNANGSLEKAFVQFVYHLLVNGIENVILYAMDGPSLNAMSTVYQKVMLLVEEEQFLQQNTPDGDAAWIKSCYIVPHILDGWSLSSLLAHSKASVNYKLHGSVTSAAVGTPFVAAAYHSKSWDFVSDIEGYPNELTITTGAIEKDHNLLIQALEKVMDAQYYAVLKDVLLKSKKTVELRWNAAVLMFLNVVQSRKNDAGCVESE